MDNSHEAYDDITAFTEYLVLKYLYSPKQFYNILNDSIVVLSLETQKCKQACCSIFFLDKTRQTNFSRHKQTI